MRRTVLTVGLLALVCGVYLLQQGPQVLDSIAGDFGLAHQYQIESPIIPQTLLTVASANYTFLSANLNAGIQVRGVVNVADGRQIAFYVMSEGNFSFWRSGRPSQVILVAPLATSYNFTFTPQTDGAYYFVFDNQDTGRRSVIFSLVALVSRTALNPIVQYAGYEAAAIGTVLLVIGIRGGRKKVEERGYVGGVAWKCKFCGAENLGDKTFCAKCQRSQK